MDHLGKAVAAIDEEPAGVMSVEQLKLFNDDELEGTAAQHKPGQGLTDSSSAPQVEELINKHLKLLRTLKGGHMDRSVKLVNGLRAMLVLQQRRQNGNRFLIQVSCYMTTPTHWCTRRHNQHHIRDVTCLHLSTPADSGGQAAGGRWCAKQQHCGA